VSEPPKILSWLLDKCCPDSRPDLKGDFLELYEHRIEENGRRFANRKLLRDIFSVVPLNFIIKEKDNHKPVSMLKTNLKIARRNLAKNKAYTAINIAGLAVSLTMCILISLFIRDELSFDKHFEGGDKVYRIAGNYSQGGADRVMAAQTTYLMKPLIENDIEGIESITRADFTFGEIKIGDKEFHESNMLFADSTFFDVFKIHFIKGDPATALDLTQSVVIDEKDAMRYFGTIDALGKTIELQGVQLAVTGVYKDLPVNTHFAVSMIVPISAATPFYPDWVLHNASGTSLYTYIRVKDNFDVAGFEAAVGKQIKKNWGWEGDSVPKYFLQSLQSIHLESHLQQEVGVNGNLSSVYIFAITGIVIFVLAFINYINLTTAASFTRSKEVGMKKVLGSTTRMQMSQFQTESFIVAVVAMVIAMIGATLTMPILNQLSGKNLDFNPFSDLIMGGGILSTLLIIGLVAGISPALVLLRSSTIGMLNNKLEFSGQRSYLRSGLIIFQFSISITLIACTLIVVDQISFIRKSDLGIDPESVILIPLQQTGVADKFELLKTEMERNPNAISVAGSSNKVTERIGGWRQYKPDPTAKDELSCPSTSVTVDYFETMKATMVDGRTFKKDIASDLTNGYILNESAVRFLNLKDPVDKDLLGVTFNNKEWFRRDGKVIGVVKDFHLASLHEKVQPIVFYLASEKTEGTTWMEIRVKSDDLPNAIESLKGTWDKVANGNPFEFEFMDDAVAQHYQAEDRFLKIFTTFSMLSIMLGGLGLFGLTAFMAKRRTKEIGIRRVLGATTSTLIRLMSKDFIALVLIANIIGWPIAWYFMNKWLADFAYKAPISPLVFIGTGIAVLLIAFLCVLYHSLKVSRINPVNSLRSE
jgi:putative ABC transport system permease protein